MGDPDDPYLVICTENGIVRNKFPVPRYHDIQRVNASLEQDRSDGGRIAGKFPYFPVREDQSHSCEEVGGLVA
jgi:hypothetical protein